MIWIPAAALLGLVLRSAWVSDDAYITMRTVDNLLHGYGLRWNVDERVQAYTHPLWMLALTLIYSVVREAFVSEILLGLFSTIGSLYIIHKLARTPWHAAIAVIALASSRTFIDFATSGLENPLSHLLLGCFIYCYLVRQRRHDLQTLAIISCLIGLNRADAILVVLPALTHASWLGIRTHGIQKTARALALGFAPLFVWELFSLLYYGSLVPNTAFAKLNTGVSKLELMVQGAVYIRDTLAWDLPLLPVLTLGLASAFCSRQLRAIMIAVGAVLYLTYVMRIGGDFMMGRFLTLPLFAAACCIAHADLPLDQPASLGLLFAALALFFLHPNATDVWPNGAIKHDGVADERSVYHDSSSLMMWSRTRDIPDNSWVHDAQRAKVADKRVQIRGCVGYFGFFAGPAVHVIDYFALTDPLLARLPAKADPFWRTGHNGREVPEGYADTVESGQCELEDKNLCEYYAKLRTVTAGDLWSWDRLMTIIGLNLGSYDHLIDFERYRYPKREQLTLEQVSTFVPENASWLSTGMHRIANDGAIVSLPNESKVALLQITLDGTDDYTIEFRRDEHSVAEVSSHSLGVGGVQTRDIHVPAAAVSRGFNSVFIRPANGDGFYSFGFLRLCL